MHLRTNGATLALAGILTMGLVACGGSADAEMSADYESPQPVTEAAHAEKAGNEMHDDAAKADAHSAMQSASTEALVVYKTESCGCCGKWVDHMKEAGFEVEVHDMTQEELSAVK
jgi:hypothetical protein